MFSTPSLDRRPIETLERSQLAQGQTTNWWSALTVTQPVSVELVRSLSTGIILTPRIDHEGRYLQGWHGIPGRPDRTCFTIGGELCQHLLPLLGGPWLLSLTWLYASPILMGVIGISAFIHLKVF